MENLETKKEINPILEPELVNLFDLLSRFDYEDKQKEKTASLDKTKEAKDNSNKTTDLRATSQNSSAKTTRDI